MSTITINSLPEFEQAVATYLAALQKQQRQLAQDVAYTIAENIVVGGAYSPGTPVDLGHARASWQMDLNGAPVSSGEAMAAGAVGVKLGDQVNMTNDAPYIRRLEYGWSKQAPAGFVRMIVNSFELIADTISKQVPAP